MRGWNERAASTFLVADVCVSSQRKEQTKVGTPTSSSFCLLLCYPKSEGW